LLPNVASGKFCQCWAKPRSRIYSA
jgi:hypothetical protein